MRPWLSREVQKLKMAHRLKEKWKNHRPRGTVKPKNSLLGTKE